MADTVHLLHPAAAAGATSRELLGELAEVEAHVAGLDSRPDVADEALRAIEAALGRLTRGLDDPPADGDGARAMALQHAFLRRMLDTVDGLLERLAERLAAGETGDESAIAARVLLDHLGRGLRVHFTHEERDGNLVRALERAPRFHRRATSLQAEHRTFLSTAAELHRTALAAECHVHVWVGVRDRFRVLRDELAAHERAENEVAQRAWNEDLGGGD